MIPSPVDPRDYIYKPLPDNKVEQFNDLRIDVSVVDDQGKQNSCVAHGVTSPCEIFMSRDLDFNQLSRSAAYMFARAEEGKQHLDQGISTRSGLEALRKRGCVYEKDWPYTDANLWAEVPGNIPWAGKLTRYERIIGSGNTLLQGIKSSLTEGCPVVISMHIYPKFLQIRGSIQEQIMLNPYRGSFDYMAGVGGNHCMCVVANSLNRLIIENSWGPNWGDKGYCAIMPEAVNDIFEAWSIKGFGKTDSDVSTIDGWLNTKTDLDIDTMFFNVVKQEPRYWAVYGLIRMHGRGKLGFKKMADMLGFTKMYDIRKWIFNL